MISEITYNLLGRFCPPFLEEKQKQQFLQDLFSKNVSRLFFDPVRVVDSEIKTPLLTSNKPALQQAIQDKAKCILNSNTAPSSALKKWSEAMTSEEGIEELFREAFKQAGTVTELSFLKSLSEDEKQQCLTLLRDTRTSTQIKRGLYSAIAELSISILIAMTVYFLIQLSWSVRAVCLLAGDRCLKQLDPDSFLHTALGIPLIEEISFRVLVQTAVKKGLSSLKPLTEMSDATIQKIAIITSSVLFGVAHFWNHPDEPEEGLAHMVSTTIGGLFLGELYDKYGLLASFSSHAGFNGLLVALDRFSDLLYDPS